MRNFDGQVNSFYAWSLCTGPSNVQKFTGQKMYVLGTWEAINTNSTSTEQIKKDIDERIRVLVEAVQLYMKVTKDDYNHFAAPEFFFRCTSGPYPSIKIAGCQVFQYIKTQIFQKLSTCLGDKKALTVIVGSILTCNVQDIPSFINTSPVKERLEILNSFYKKQVQCIYNQANSIKLSAPIIKKLNNCRQISPPSRVPISQYYTKAIKRSIISTKTPIEPFKIYDRDPACIATQSQQLQEFKSNMGQLETVHSQEKQMRSAQGWNKGESH